MVGPCVGEGDLRAAALYATLLAPDISNAQVPAFLTQNLHQPDGLMVPSTSVQELGA